MCPCWSVDSHVETSYRKRDVDSVHVLSVCNEGASGRQRCGMDVVWIVQRCMYIYMACR